MRNGHAAVPLLFAQKEPRSGKGFNFVCAKLWFCALIQGLENLELPERETVLFFSLVRKEPKVPQRFANLWTPGTIQSSVEENFSIASGGTSRTRLFVQIGGEKALNRCEVRALQRKNLERRLKEQRCSLRTVGYGWLGGNGKWRAK